jgi:hypothetical protein
MLLFWIKGMRDQIKMKKKVAPTSGTWSCKASTSLVPNIDAVSDSSSAVKLDFEGDFNPMMA